jgi:hypothetical protein
MMIDAGTEKYRNLVKKEKGVKWLLAPEGSAIPNATTLYRAS